MNWAFKARDDGYFQKKQRAPSHQTFKKIEYIISSISYRGKLLVKQWQSEPNLGFQLPCTLHYFDPVGLLGGFHATRS